jgi:hypothetical protein
VPKKGAETPEGLIGARFRGLGERGESASANSPLNQGGIDFKDVIVTANQCIHALVNLARTLATLRKPVIKSLAFFQVQTTNQRIHLPILHPASMVTWLNFDFEMDLFLLQPVE